MLNITVFFTDNQTSLHISGATVQLIGEGNIINFTVDFNQYTLILNTRDLKIGVSLFTIVAQANNFQIKTIDLRITVNRIKITPSTLSGESYLTGLEGGTVTLRIILNNTNVLPFGELIKNANVTFTWAYGLGKFLENNGIYEVDLDLNVPAGTYIIRIYVEDEFVDYVFEYNSENGHVISLNVNARQGLDLTWLIYSLIGGIAGIVVIFTLYQTHFKYPPMVRKIRKLRKKVKKGKKLKSIALNDRENLIGSITQKNLQILDSSTLDMDKELSKNIKNLKED
jgi:hypothetical protein